MGGDLRLRLVEVLLRELPRGQLRRRHRQQLLDDRRGLDGRLELVEDQVDLVAGWINTITENVDNDEVIAKVGLEVEELCKQFPLPEQFVPDAQ